MIRALLRTTAAIGLVIAVSAAAEHYTYEAAPGAAGEVAADLQVPVTLGGQGAGIITRGLLAARDALGIDGRTITAGGSGAHVTMYPSILHLISATPGSFADVRPSDRTWSYTETLDSIAGVDARPGLGFRDRPGGHQILHDMIDYHEIGHVLDPARTDSDEPDDILAAESFADAFGALMAVHRHGEAALPVIYDLSLARAVDAEDDPLHATTPVLGRIRHLVGIVGVEAIQALDVEGVVQMSAALARMHRWHVSDFACLRDAGAACAPREQQARAEELLRAQAPDELQRLTAEMAWIMASGKPEAARQRAYTRALVRFGALESGREGYVEALQRLRDMREVDDGAAW